MLENAAGLPDGMVGVKATGKVTREDYEKVFVPLLDEARREGRRLRFLYELGENAGFTAGAAWEDARLGLASLRLFDGCAVVTDTSWIREATQLAGMLMPCPVRAFETSAREAAIAWLRTLPEAASISHHLDPARGIITIEVTEALRKQDFDDLAVVADAWIEAHGTLSGIVIHARRFPGWENLGSMARHFRFLRDHQRKIQRIALAADFAVPAVLQDLAEHFVKAEVKAFGYDQLDAARDWASGAAPQA
jgi:hypothetical protein